MVTTTEKGIDVYEAGPDAPFPAVPDEPNEPSFIVGHVKNKFPANVLELTPKNDTESITEKFNRLKSDAFLLHEQIEREALKEEMSVQIRPVDELKLLINSLKKAIENPSESSEINSHMIRLNSLKDRIQTLEESLGLDGNVVEDQPLLKVVEQLKTRIQILTPGYLTGVFKRVQELNKQSSANVDAISSLNTNEVISKDDKPTIVELSALINRWDERCKELVPLVESMKVSQGLYQDAERVILKWEKLVTIKNSVEQTLAFQKKEQELSEQRNSQRIKRLLERIDSLKEYDA